MFPPPPPRSPVEVGSRPKSEAVFERSRTSSSEKNMVGSETMSQLNLRQHISTALFPCKKALWV